MRSRQVNYPDECRVSLGLTLPDIKNGPAYLIFQQGGKKRTVVNHLSPGSIYKETVILHLHKVPAIDQVTSLILAVSLQRDMQSNDVRSRKQFLKGDEIFQSLTSFSWGVI